MVSLQNYVLYIVPMKYSEILHPPPELPHIPWWVYLIFFVILIGIIDGVIHLVVKTLGFMWGGFIPYFWRQITGRDNSGSKG